MSHTESGMSLVEMLIATAILGIALTAAYLTWTTSTRITKHADISYQMSFTSDEIATVLDREFKAAPPDSVRYIACREELENGDRRGCRSLRFTSFARDEDRGERITITTVCRRASAPLSRRLRPRPMANCFRPCPGNYALRVRRGNKVMFYPREPGETLKSVGGCFDQKGDGLIARLQIERQYMQKQRIKNYRNLVIEDFNTFGDDLVEIAENP